MNNQSPLSGFVCGLLMFLLAVVSTFTGKTYIKGITDRTKSPSDYWTVLLIQYVCGACLMWWFWADAFNH